MHYFFEKFGGVAKILFVLLVFFLVLVQSRWAMAQEPHACDYLLPAMVEEVMGMPVLEVESKEANPLGQSVCFFKLSNTEMYLAQVQMMCSSWPGMENKKWTAKSLFENNMSFLDNLEEEQGLGDQAYWAGSELRLGTGLHVLADDCFFTILALAGGDEAINRAKARELAVKVLGMLGKE